MIEVCKITSKEEWLKMRMKDVTSTEVSALFDMSPYMTRFELWHEKKSGYAAQRSSERMDWGNRLEPVIADAAAAKLGVSIEKSDVYVRDDSARIGASFDYFINDSNRGIIEVKNVDYLTFKNKWIEYDHDDIEAPEHIELQVQHQMEVANIDYCYITALVGGNKHVIVKRERDKEIGELIRSKVCQFWETVDKGVEPAPDFDKDSGYIIKYLRSSSAKDEIVADEDLEEMLTLYGATIEQRRELDCMVDAIKAKILYTIGDGVGKVKGKSGTLSCGMTQGSKGTVITQDMVGKVIGDRKPYRLFRFIGGK